MSEATNTNGGESGLQILNNIGYLLGVPFLLILAVILLAWWQYRRRKQRIAAITGTGATSSSSTSSSTSISSKIWSWRWYVFLGGSALLLLWWQWDEVVQFWQSDDWLGQLWSLVQTVNDLGESWHPWGASFWQVLAVIAIYLLAIHLGVERFKLFKEEGLIYYIIAGSTTLYVLVAVGSWALIWLGEKLGL